MPEPHVISALVEKRARLMGEIANRRFQIMRIETEIRQIDAVIKMFKPEYDLEAILPKVTFRKNPAGTPKGAGGRYAFTVLREAGCPLEAREIARRVLGKLNKPETDKAVDMLAATIHSTFGRRKDGAVAFDATTWPGTWRLVIPSLPASGAKAFLL
jgi:hypothetical protein